MVTTDAALLAFLKMWLMLNTQHCETSRGIGAMRFSAVASRTRFMLAGMLLFALATGAFGASNFVRVQLGRGASIEIPKNWMVLSGSQRTTIDSFVEAKGYRLTESTLGFAANLYDDNGKTRALVNVRFYPENPITQSEARQATAEDLRSIDMEMQKVAEVPLKAMGIRMLNWYGSKMQVINGLYVLVHEHQHSGAGDAGVTRVRGVRVWRSPRSFTMTLSYRERDAVIMLPIIDYMTDSIRQD